MTVVAFDTYELIKKLKDSGFEELQAEALADAFVTTQETYLADLVTSQELKDVRQELKQDIAQLRQEIKELGFKMDIKYESMKGEIILIKWMMGIMIAGILSLILKAFF